MVSRPLSDGLARFYESIDKQEPINDLKLQYDNITKPIPDKEAINKLRVLCLLGICVLFFA